MMHGGQLEVKVVQMHVGRSATSIPHKQIRDETIVTCDPNHLAAVVEPVIQGRR